MTSENAVTIIGTGDFGRALAKPLLQAGYEVYFGSRRPESRNPAARDPALASAKVVTISEAVQASKIVFMVLHPTAQEQLKVFEKELKGKILVDVSNVEKATTESNAEKLQKLFPESHVVKAFNTLSAYTLMTGHSTASMDVHIAGNDDAAVQTMINVVRRMGYTAIPRGKLMTARDIETMNSKLFTGWGAPLIVASSIMAIWVIYQLIRSHVIKNRDWNQLPMMTLSMCLGTTSITLLALCYLPGSIAAFTQLYNGTKHVKFSSFLSRWLKIRKEMGLIALWLAALHGFFSLPQVNPGYNPWWFPNSELVVTIPANQTQDVRINLGHKMDWIGECVIACGALGLGFTSILAITSLPSVGARMNWQQWTFVQSYLGYLCLILTAAHVSFITCPTWATRAFADIVQTTNFLSLQLPYFTLFLRFLLLLPCLSVPVKKIRQGWERGANNDIEAGGKTSSSIPNGHNNAAFQANESTSKL